jgi:hypothetical protein
VLVLSNLAALTPEQNAAVERFLADGGGVLAAFGDRADAAALNRSAYRGGRGWLPARLVEVVGTDGDPTAGPRPRSTAFEHAAVRVFRDELTGGLHTAYFPRHWKLEPDPALPRGEILGTLTTGDPFLIGKTVGAGRVIAAAVPLDNGWRTNLTGLPDFVRLAHELAYYLAAGLESTANVAPGEPIVFRPRDDEPAAAVTVLPPDGVAKVVPVREWPAVFDSTRDPGPYKLTTGRGQVRFYAVRHDPREADLTPADAGDRMRVAQSFGPLDYVATPEDLLQRRGRGPATSEFGGMLLFGVLALLAAELWYTRKLANRG